MFDDDRTRRLVAAVLVLVLAAGVVTAAVSSISLSNNDDGAVQNQPNGPTANLTGNVDVYNDSGSVDNDTIQWNTSAGSVQFTASDEASATIAASEITGTWTNVTAVNATQANLTINPEDKERATVGDGVDALSYRSASLDDGQVDLVYSASSEGVITVRGLPANQTIAAGATNGENLGAFETDSNGNLTMVAPAQTEAEVVLFTNSDPQPQNSTASPNNTTIQQTTVTLSMDVNDSDFATSAGDNVTAEIYLDGEHVGSDYTTANGTVSTDVSGLTGGSHDWYVEFADEYNGTATSATFTFEAPDELEVREEQRPHGLINDTNVSLEVTFYSGEETYIREDDDSDGRINMTGLPTDQSFVVVAEAEGYHNRRIVVDSLVDTQTIFLLNNSSTTNQILFKLDDQTGQFQPSDTRLYIQKSVNLSQDSQPQYRTIAGDYFGATESFPARLVSGDRYRLVVRTDGGNSRVLGSYIPEVDKEEDLTIGQVNFDIGGQEDYAWNVSLDRYEDNDDINQTVRFHYTDPSTLTENLELEVHERGNESNVIATASEPGPLGNLSFTYELTEAQENKTWVVNWTAERNGERIGGRQPAAANTYPIYWTLDPMLEKLLIGLLVVFMGGFFTKGFAREGAVIVSAGAGVLWSMGWLNIPPKWVLAALAISVASVMAKAGGVNSR